MLVDGGGCTLAGDRWWWICFGWRWLVMNGGGCWWVVAWFSLTQKEHEKRSFLVQYLEWMSPEKMLVKRQTNILRKHWRCLRQLKKLPISFKELKFEKIIWREFSEVMLKMQKIYWMSRMILHQLLEMATIWTVKNSNWSYLRFVAPKKRTETS